MAYFKPQGLLKTKIILIY